MGIGEAVAVVVLVVVLQARHDRIAGCLQNGGGMAVMGGRWLVTAAMVN